MAGLKKIGIFGGTFDPVHLGHLRIALHIFEEFDLNQIRFIPAGNPPNKLNKQLTDSKIRFEMVRNAVSNWPDKFAADDIEIKRDGPSFMIQTVLELKKQFIGAEFFLLIGNDNLADFSNWREWQRLLEEIRIIYFSKDKSELHVPDSLKNFGHRILKSKAPLLEINSTEIRNRISSGKNVDLLLMPETFQFIKIHNLYQL